jgi:putative transposase
MKISDNLQKNIKFVLNQISQYKFQQHLQHKCDEYGCKLLIVTEKYTLQCCEHCGNLSKKFNKRIKTCNYCGTIYHRDINGNISLKYATKYRIS